MNQVEFLDIKHLEKISDIKKKLTLLPKTDLLITQAIKETYMCARYNGFDTTMFSLTLEKKNHCRVVEKRYITKDMIKQILKEIGFKEDSYCIPENQSLHLSFSHNVNCQICSTDNRLLYSHLLIVHRPSNCVN